MRSGYRLSALTLISCQEEARHSVQSAKSLKRIYETNHRLATIFSPGSDFRRKIADIIMLIFSAEMVKLYRCLPFFSRCSSPRDTDTQDRILDPRKLDRCTRTII